MVRWIPAYVCIPKSLMVSGWSQEDSSLLHKTSILTHVMYGWVSGLGLGAMGGGPVGPIMSGHEEQSPERHPARHQLYYHYDPNPGEHTTTGSLSSLTPNPPGELEWIAEPWSTQWSAC